MPVTPQPRKRRDESATKSRLPHTRAPRGRVCLQERDVALLVELYQFGCLLREHIQARFFGSKPRANARLRQLYDGHFVERADLPEATAAGQCDGLPAVYLLGTTGVPVVASQLGEDPATIRQSLRKGTPAYLQHSLEIVRFHLALEASLRDQPGVTLHCFLPKRRCRHAYEVRRKSESDAQKKPWRTEVYKPDAVFALACSGTVHAFAVEIDLGHTSSAEFARKLEIHARCAVSGQFVKRFDTVKTATLIVTTSPQRRDNLRRIAHAQAGLRFLFATFADIQAQGIPASIWHTPDGADPVALL